MLSLRHSIFFTDSKVTPVGVSVHPGGISAHHCSSSCKAAHISDSIDWRKAGVHAARKEAKKKSEARSQKSEIAEFVWKHNALRHSFISYRVADIQNVAQVALEAGNSPRIIFSNYRELVRPADAKTWFSIAPEKRGNVVDWQLKKAKAA